MTHVLYMHIDVLVGITYLYAFICARVKVDMYVYYIHTTCFSQYVGYIVMLESMNARAYT